jgi:hypothetical protein
VWNEGVSTKQQVAGHFAWGKALAHKRSARGCDSFPPTWLTKDFCKLPPTRLEAKPRACEQGFQASVLVC